MPKQAKAKKEQQLTRQRSRAAYTNGASYRANRLSADPRRLLTQPETSTPGDVLALQRTIGNRATTRFVQTNLDVNRLDSCRAPRLSSIQHKKEQSELRTKVATEQDGFEVSSQFKTQLHSQSGRGRPLPDSIRAFMEPRFNADFSKVRVHVGKNAAQISRQINAKAFTHEQDIYFGAGAYRPGSDAGKRLLAHELTHVVQQSTGTTLRREEETQAKLDLYGVSNISKPMTTLYGLRSQDHLLIEADPSQLHGQNWIDVVLFEGAAYPYTVKRDDFNTFVAATGIAVPTVEDWFENKEQSEQTQKSETETTGYTDEETSSGSESDEGSQIWSVSRFRAETKAGRLARRDKTLKAIDKKLGLFHYQKEQSKGSTSDTELYESLRILEAIFEELQTFTYLWIEKVASGNGKQQRRLDGMRAFQALLKQQTLLSIEKAIIIEVVQRHLSSEDIDTELLENSLGTFGSSADLLGGSGRGERWEATTPETISGGSFGLLFNLFGLGIGSAKIHKEHKDKKNAKKELELLKYKLQGQDELFGATALLKKQVSQANKGLASDSVAVGSSLNGIFNAISTIIQGASSGATAAMAGLLANVTFAVGYGVGAILNLIQAGRDFYNIYKRKKGQKAVARVIEAYNQRLGNLHDEINDAYERMTDIAGDTSLSLEEALTQTEQEAKTIRAHQDEIATLEARRSAFVVSKRKQGAGIKSVQATLNLIGAAGGTALTVAGIAAAIGTGAAAATLAAAGPVGWALAGTALLGILAFAIGTKIKQSIRRKNVKRMRQEIGFVNEYIDKGTIDGVPSPAYDEKGNRIAKAARNVTFSPSTRQYHAWHRFMVQPAGVKVEKKGWFNRLISRRKSGTLSMKGRRDALRAYLEKYDKQKAGQNAIEGIVTALGPGAAGDVQVDVDDPKNPGTKKTLTMRQVMHGLLQSYFPKDWQKMRSSLLSEDERLRKGAEQRFLSKLKLS